MVRFCVQSVGMRYPILAFIIALSSAFMVQPAYAQGWSTYDNARYGAHGDVPPGYAPLGPEAANSDGLMFRSDDGTAYLTIFGADVGGKDFETYVRDLIAHEESYNGWGVQGATVTPDWAEFTGSGGGGRQLRVRVLSSCAGRQVVAVKYEFSAGRPNDADRVLRSLSAGTGHSC